LRFINKIGVLMALFLLISIPLQAIDSLGDRFSDLVNQDLVVQFPIEALEQLPHWEQEEQVRDWVLYSCLMLLDVPINSLLVHPAGQLPIREPMLAPLYSSQNGRIRWAWIDDTPHDSRVGDLLMVVPSGVENGEIGLVADEFRSVTGSVPNAVYVFTYNPAPRSLVDGEVWLQAARSVAGDDMLPTIESETSSPFGYAEVIIDGVFDLADFLRWADRLVHVRIEDGRLIAGGRNTHDGEGAITVDDIAVLYEAYERGWEAGFSLDWRGCTFEDLVALQQEALILPRINALALSPTEDRILVGRSDSAADLRPADQADPVALLEHEGEVLAVAYTRDGKTVATGATDGCAGIWRASDGSPLTKLAHDDWVRSIAFSPDGTLIVTGCDDGYTRLWSIEDGKLVSEFDHPDWVRSVTFSPDGTLLATGCDDGYARLWSIEDGKPVSEFDHPDWVRSVTFSPDGTLLATGCDDGAVRLWHVPTGELKAAFDHPLSALYQLILSIPPGFLTVAFSADGSLLAAGDWDGWAHVWSVPDETYVNGLLHNGEVTSVLFSSGGDCLLTGCGDGNIRTWSLPDGELLREEWVWGTAIDEETWYWVVSSLIVMNVEPFKDLVDKLAGVVNPNAQHLCARLRACASTLDDQLAELLSQYCCQCARYEGWLEGTAVGMTWFYGDLLAKLWAIDWSSSTPEEEIGMISVLDQPISYSTWEEINNYPDTRIWFEPRYADWSQSDTALFFGRQGARIFAASPIGFSVEADPTPDKAAFIRWWEAHWEEIEEYEPEYVRLGELEKWSTVLAWLQGRGELDLFDAVETVSIDRSWQFDRWLTATDNELNADLVLLEPESNWTECIPLFSSEPHPVFGVLGSLQGGVSGGNSLTLAEETPEEDEFLTTIAEILKNGQGSLTSPTGTLLTFSSLSADYGTCQAIIEQDVRLRSSSSEVKGADALVAELIGTSDGEVTFQSCLRAHASPDVPLSKAVFSAQARGKEIRIAITVERGALAALSDLASRLALREGAMDIALAEQPGIGECRELPDGSWLVHHDTLSWLRVGTADPVRGPSVVGEAMHKLSTVTIVGLCDAEAHCWDLLAEGVDPVEVAHRLDSHQWKEALDTVVRPYLDQAGVPYDAKGNDIVVISPADRIEPWFLTVPSDPVHRLLVFGAISQAETPVVWVAEGSTVERARHAWWSANLQLNRPTTVFLSAGSDVAENVLTTWAHKTAERQAQADHLGIPWTFVNLHEYSADRAAEIVRAALEDTSRNVLLFAHRLDWGSFDLGNGGSLGLDWLETAARGTGDRVLGLVGCNSLFFGLNDPLVAPITGVVDFSLTTGETLTAPELFEQLESLLEEIGRRRKAEATKMPLRDILKELKSLRFIALDELLINRT